MSESNDSGRAARSWIAILISVAALCVSVLAYATPILDKQWGRSSTIGAFLNALIQPTSRGVKAGAIEAEPDSAASKYVTVLGTVWTAWEGAFGGPATLGSGSVSESGSGKYEVCFPDIDVLPAGCQTFGDFEFTTDDQNIVRFSVNGTPVAEMTDTSAASVTTIEHGRVQVWSQVALIDPDATKQTLVFWTALAGNTSNPKLAYSLDSLYVQNGQEEELTDVVSHSPDRISRYDSALAVIRTDVAAHLIYSCWTIHPAEKDYCVWLNLDL